MVIHISVYFEGTSNSLRMHSTQIGLFADLTDAVDLWEVSDLTGTSGSDFKIAFDGCGVTNGTIGLLFATGLQQQCDLVHNIVNGFIHRLENGNKIVLNVVGLSRGGIAAIYLAKTLKYIDDSILTLNLLLFDPVPGNLISTSFLDLFGFNTASNSIDISDCKNLQHVLALYPFEPLPDLAFHAPVIPNYPSTALVVEDAVPGCHQGALFCTQNIESILSFVRIKQWLIDRGTTFKQNGRDASEALLLSHSNDECEEIMDELVTAHLVTKRIVRHAHSWPRGATIECSDPRSIGGIGNASALPNEDGKLRQLYLNKWHRDLACAADNTGSVNEEGTIECVSEYLLRVNRPSRKTETVFSSRSI
jgi:hypothetical protein